MELNTKDTQILCTTIAITGIIIISLLTTEKYISIGEIENSNIGEKIITSGKIKNLSLNGGHAFFELENGGRIKAVFFKPPTKEMIKLRENELIRAEGRIELYKNELEIIIEKVTQIE